MPGGGGCLAWGHGLAGAAAWLVGAAWSNPAGPRPWALGLYPLRDEGLSMQRLQQKPG